MKCRTFHVQTLYRAELEPECKGSWCVLKMSVTGHRDWWSSWRGNKPCICVLWKFWHHFAILMSHFVSLQVEAILSKNRYLVGDQLTEADIRLFTTLVRFDTVYHTHFKVRPPVINMTCRLLLCMILLDCCGRPPDVSGNQFVKPYTQWYPLKPDSPEMKFFLRQGD